MEAALSPDMLATDLAYYLVRKGVSRSYILKILYYVDVNYYVIDIQDMKLIYIIIFFWNYNFVLQIFLEHNKLLSISFVV